MFASVRGVTTLVVHPLAIAAVVASVTAGVGVVWVVRRLVVAAATACSSVCAAVRLSSLPVGRGYGGDVGVGGGGGGIGFLAVGGHHDGRIFVGVRGGVVSVARPLPVAAVGQLVALAVAAVWAVRQLAITSAAACSSVCGVVRRGWPARFPLPWSPCRCWRRWRRYGRFASWRSPRRPRAFQRAGGCSLGGPPVVRGRGGRVGECGGGGGSGGSPDGGRRGDRVFVGVGNCVVWSLCRLAVAAAATLVLAAAVAAWAVWRLAVTAAAGCFSVRGWVRFEWPARCP